MDFLANQCEGFSGADMTELCQRATKAAIRESIACEEERKKLMTGDEDANMEMDDPVPVITRTHFEEAMANARRSVTDYDLNKFEQFRSTGQRTTQANSKTMLKKTMMIYTHEQINTCK